MYYEKDPSFFLTVIKKEEPPFEFKIHLFTPQSEEGEGNRGGYGDSFRAQKNAMLAYLQDNYQADRIDVSTIRSKNVN